MSLVVLIGLSSVGRGDGSDLRFDVSIGRGKEPIFRADLSKASPDFIRTKRDSQSDLLTVTFTQPILLKKDVRIKFSSDSPSIPKGYEHCAFYFW